jgi:ribose transport system substrate-binding protein
MGTVLLTATAVLGACGSSAPGAVSTGSVGGATISLDASSTQSPAAYLRTVEGVPKKIPITEPLKTAPPKGKTFVFLQCDIAQCTQESTALKAVTAAIGWKLKTIPYQSANPASLIAGLQQALQYKPAGVGLSGVPEIEWKSVLPAYKSAGVPIVVAYVGPQPLTKTIIANVGSAQSVAVEAHAVADYFIVKSGGKGHILQFQVPDYPILATFDTSFRQYVKAGCSGCSVTQLNGTVAEADGGTTVPAIVSALQRNPQDTWVVTDDGPWVDGLPAAASAAGLHPKIIGEGGDVTDETDIQAGTMTAFTALALNYGQWAMVDAVLRHMEGMAIPSNEGVLPTQLLVKGESFAVSESYDEPSNYSSLMEKLWHVG